MEIDAGILADVYIFIIQIQKELEKENGGEIDRTN